MILVRSAALCPVETKELLDICGVLLLWFWSLTVHARIGIGWLGPLVCWAWLLLWSCGCQHFIQSAIHFFRIFLWLLLQRVPGLLWLLSRWWRPLPFLGHSFRGLVCESLRSFIVIHDADLCRKRQHGLLFDGFEQLLVICRLFFLGYRLVHCLIIIRCLRSRICWRQILILSCLLHGSSLVVPLVACLSIIEQRGRLRIWQIKIAIWSIDFLRMVEGLHWLLGRSPVRALHIVKSLVSYLLADVLSFVFALSYERFVF